MQRTMNDKALDTSEIKVGYIDLREVVEEKSPGLYDKIPGFVIRYLRKIAHIDDINALMQRANGKVGLEFSTLLMEEFGVSVTTQGLENIPKEGRILFASNHPLGGFDGMALFHAVIPIRQNLIFQVNDFLMYLENMRRYFIPVNKLGSNASNVRRLEMAYRGDDTLLIFPAGLCSRKNKGEICDLEWKKTFVTKAKHTKRDIIPVFISGHNSRRFYRIARWRKFFGIRFNIEMMYLVDEAYRLKDKNIRIIFGKPIPWTVFDNRYRDVEWAQRVKNHVYRLEKNPNAEFSVDKEV
ncbi:MAG: 1-acyl-sn-glycerol-3-phosphate acyltransferase [Bacteroidales bacterium]|nr:1-acyl-sn-glycerol-3-phosphate acyltransferase [Bacteroidales bacterium]